MKRLIPNSLKPRIRNWYRKIEDFRSGAYENFAKFEVTKVDFPFIISLSQPLKKNSGLEGKVKNMKLAISVLEKIIIQPNEIFSFWRYLQEPTVNNGYTKGRTIVNGELKESIGGGLCQLGGLIYHISLIANLKIIERHNHSLDLYDDNTRYSPLGADAAVAFGYKDLRILNPFSFPIKFHFQIFENNIEIQLKSLEEIKEIQPVFNIKELNNIKQVETWVDGVLLETSHYKTGEKL